MNSAGTDSLTLTAGAGTIQCNGIVGPALGLLSIVSAGTVNFTQPVQCEEIRQVAGTGTTTFGNIVTISNPTTTTAINLTGTAFTFSGAVTTTGYGNVSITNSGVLTISNTAPFVLAGSFTKNGGGTVTLGADITTANASISFNGAVTLTDPVTLTTNGTTTTNGITFSSAVSGGNNILTIRAGSGAVSLNGIPSSYSSSGTGGGLDVVNSGSIAVAGALSAGSENIKLGSAGAITLNGQVSTGSAGTVTITNAGVLTLNSGAHFDTLAGSLTQNGAGSVTLNANINIITVNQNVAFDSLISGLSNLLTINAGSGAVFLNGIPSSYSSSGTGGGLDVVNSGSIAVAGALSAGSGNIKLVSAGAVTLNGQVSTDSAGTVTITNAGVLTLNSGAHFDTLAGSLTQNGAGGVTLNANINIITVNQNVTFNSLISGSSNLLTINAGSGAVFLNGTLSSYTSTGTGGGLNIANSGSILIAGALSAGGGHLNMVSDGTITLSGTVNTTNNGNVTITNGGLLRINSGANFNLTAGNFLQNGVGDVVCAGGLIVTGTGTITFGTTTDTPPVYFAGNPLNSNFTISASAIKFFGDVHIYLPSRTIFFSNSFTCRNFILYNGTVNLNGATSANKILTTEQDFVAFGAGYTITDSVSSSTNLFAYNNPLRDDPAYGFASPKAPLITASTIHGISFLPIYNTALGGYNNSTGLAGQFAGLSDARIYVGAENNINGNFYVNGCNMNPGSQWELVIPDNGNSANAFAEAYNMSVSNCSVNLTSPYNTRESWVAAGECGPANVVNSPRWAGPQYSLMDGKGMGSNLIPLALPIDWNIATGVDISNSYSSGGSYDIGCVTIFDDVIRIQMNAPLGSGVLFENDNNEISKAVEAGALWINGSAIKTTPFIDRECTTTTDGAGDLAVFYLQVPPADTWNTDATGASSGDPDSTDMSGNKNRGVTPNIYAPKATNTIYFSLLDNRKNRVTHSPAPALFANVADFCRPVVVDIQTGRDQNTLGSTYNWHNYFQITYSEPVDIGTGADVFPGTAVTSVDGGVRATANFDPSLGQYGGHLYESGANTVTMSGYFSYQGPQVKFKSASNDSMPETNSLFRTTATPPAGGVHGLRIYVVGWRANAAPTTPWPGYMWDVFPPEGRDATIIASDMVLDANKNSINIFDRDNVTPKTITITADVSAYSNIGYPKWLQPEIAPYMRVINEVVGIDIREVVILDTNNNGLTDRLEFHIFNPTDPSQKWDTDGHHPEDYGPPMVNTFNNGKGIRESSFDSGRFYDAFRIGYDTDPILSQLPGITLSQFVNNSLFNPNLAAINYADDTYFSITFNDIALQLDSLLPHIFSYESHVGKLTDLAGNLLKSVSSAMTVEVAPPMIQYTIASAGGTKIYVKFSEHVFCADRDILTNKYTLINENHFEIAKPGDAPGSSSSAYRVDSVIPIEIKDSIVGPGVIDAYFILNRPLDPDDLLVEKIRVLDGKVCNTAGLTMMPATQYRISNFAIGLVEPVWAMDNFDVDGSSSANITIRDFAGKDKLRASDITVEVKTNTTNTSLPVTMYFDADPPASVRVASGFWLPTMFRGFNAAANNAARALSPVLSNGALKDFVIPESDNEMTEGKDIEFIFNFAGLYTGYLLDPSDPRTITTWKIPIRGIKKQRGGVTILNNVINVSRGEKAILMYDLPKTGAVTVNIFSLSGDVVKTLVKGTQPKGSYSYTWDGTNTGGRKVARGIYFIRVVGPDIDEYRKVMVVKNR
ncbi:MAG: hypothetical protein FWE72_03440 [Spirochaetaceae bacterium]|nr:hypothetical protein [Spirochaetaceae bacterium]